MLGLLSKQSMDFFLTSLNFDCFGGLGFCLDNLFHGVIADLRCWHHHLVISAMGKDSNMPEVPYLDANTHVC